MIYYSRSLALPHHDFLVFIIFLHAARQTLLRIASVKHGLLPHYDLPYDAGENGAKDENAYDKVEKRSTGIVCDCLSLLTICIVYYIPRGLVLVAASMLAIGQ